MDTRKRSIRILMFPWLAHGHISPFLELAKSLTNRNFMIYICSSPINLTSIRKQLTDKDSVSIKLVELQIPTSEELPPHYHTTNGLPPHLMTTLKKAFEKSRPCFSNLLKNLAPDLVLYDFLQPWAPEEAALQNIPAVLFLSPGATACTYLKHQFFYKLEEFEYPFPGIYLREREMQKFSDMLESTGSEKMVFKDCVDLSCDIVLIKTFRELEGKYIDYLPIMGKKRYVPTGPLVNRQAITDDRNEIIIEWLDQKDKGSTVFASFGSEYFLSENEIQEIAIGLELSGVNFIWVVRFPAGGEKVEIREKLPKGFLERVEGRGIVVDGWAPQGRILSHKSIGGFLSHCGWSSVMEAIYFAVPIIALPMHLDQPLNARLAVEVGFALEVARGGDGNLDREEVRKVIREVVNEHSGVNVRGKVKELSQKVRDKGDDEINVVVGELMTLCRRKKERMSL